MELLITYTLQGLLFPPGGFLLLMLLGLLLLHFRPLLARWLIWSGLVMGYLLSTYFVASTLLRQLQEYPALTPEQVAVQVKQFQPRAIVVLSSDRYENAPEYGHDTVGGATLERVRYGAYLHHQTGLPLVVSGGFVLNSKGMSLAAVMAESLQNDFGVKDVWLEDRSRTTAENAIYTQQLLHERGIDRVLLVTHSYHMPRAVAIFEKSGVKVIPAPTRLVVESESDAPAFMSWLPSAGALEVTSMALHELVGRLWYWLRY